MAPGQTFSGRQINQQLCWEAAINCRDSFVLGTNGASFLDAVTSSTPLATSTAPPTSTSTPGNVHPQRSVGTHIVAPYAAIAAICPASTHQWPHYRKTACHRNPHVWLRTHKRALPLDASWQPMACYWRIQRSSSRGHCLDNVMILHAYDVHYMLTD